MLVDAIKMVFAIALRKVPYCILFSFRLHSEFFLEIVGKKYVLKGVNDKMLYYKSQLHLILKTLRKESNWVMRHQRIEEIEVDWFLSHYEHRSRSISSVSLQNRLTSLNSVIASSIFVISCLMKAGCGTIRQRYMTCVC